MWSYFVETTRNPLGRNGVQVDVNHHSGPQAFIATAFPVTAHNGCVTINLSDVDSQNRVTLAPSKINHAKQRRIWEQTAKNQIKLRQGHIWDLVLRVCEKHDLVPV